MTLLSYVADDRLRIALPYQDSRRASLSIIPFEPSKEMYVTGFGLNGREESEYIEEWLEIKESSVNVHVGCIEDCKSEDVEELLSTFHGVCLEGPASSLCIRLTHAPPFTILTVTNEGEIMYEEEIENQTAFYPGLRFDSV